MITLRIQIDPFERVYLLRDPEVVQSAMFGPMLSGEFNLEDEPDGAWDLGSFRIDRMTLCEELPEQLEMAA